MSAAPAQVRLWFSAVVDARFSTAMVEDEGHAYVNTRDASLSPADAREMEVPFRLVFRRESTRSSGARFPIVTAWSWAGPLVSPSFNPARAFLSRAVTRSAGSVRWPGPGAGRGPSAARAPASGHRSAQRAPRDQTADFPAPRVGCGRPETAPEPALGAKAVLGISRGRRDRALPRPGGPSGGAGHLFVREYSASTRTSPAPRHAGGTHGISRGSEHDRFALHEVALR